MKNIIISNERNKYGLLAGIIGIISNSVLAIIKLLIGLISNSVSIMADAINSFSDTASSIFTIIGFKLADKNPTKEHPYGFARYEYISGFIIALFMLFMGIIFVKESILKIIIPQTLDINFSTFLVLFIAIVIKIIQMLLYLRISKKINSNTLKALAVDSKNDILSTTAILLSMIVMIIFDINIDGYIGLIVSIIIIISSFKTIKEVLNPIIGIVSIEQVNYIKEKILSYECVKGIHDLVIHNYGVNNDFVTVHVEVDSKMSMIEAHDFMDIIERDFKENMGISLTIHIDPVIIGNKSIDKLKNKIIKIVSNFDSTLSIHDFRVIKGKNITNVLFDVVVPYEKSYTKEEIISYLESNIKKSKYKFLIEIDKPYC